MSTATKLQEILATGVHRIGQIEILTEIGGYPYVLCHVDDAANVSAHSWNDLGIHEGPSAARDLSTYADDGTYRFTKGQINLKSGWVMPLKSAEDLRLALDHFYPACVGLFIAHRGGLLEIETLREKLNRQTGMYRFARSISDAGAQKLVQEVCGPAHQCAKRILWQIDTSTPLDPSPASQFNGIPSGPEQEAIPLMCREACNHFVAECRKTAKAEFEAKQQN